jgi:hypothetical protein
MTPGPLKELEDNELPDADIFVVDMHPAVRPQMASNVIFRIMS